jgi:hypothetical protein
MKRGNHQTRSPSNSARLSVVWVYVVRGSWVDLWAAVNGSMGAGGGGRVRRS